MQTTGTACARFTAATFGAVVSGIATTVLPRWVLAVGGAATVEIRRPRGQAQWTLALRVSPGAEPLRAVMVARGEMFDFEVVTLGEGEELVLAEGFRGVEAALGFALDYVAAPVWGRGAQAEPDTFAV